MPTSTPRLQLTKPVGNESMALGAAQLADAYSKIDAAMGVKKFATQGAATSTFIGDLIRENSTGQSKLFNSVSWLNIFDDNNGRGKPVEGPQSANDYPIFPGNPEDTVANVLLNVQAGRKYLANFNINLSAQNFSGGTLQGFIRILFKWINSSNPASIPNIVVHDIASYISATNSSKSKNMKGMFEFFPNVTGVINFGLFAQIITGNELCTLNQGTTTSAIYLTDWGV